MFRSHSESLRQFLLLVIDFARILASRQQIPYFKHREERPVTDPGRDQIQVNRKRHLVSISEPSGRRLDFLRHQSWPSCSSSPSDSISPNVFTRATVSRSTICRPGNISTAVSDNGRWILNAGRAAHARITSTHFSHPRPRTGVLCGHAGKGCTIRDLLGRFHRG